MKKLAEGLRKLFRPAQIYEEDYLFVIKRKLDKDKSQAESIHEGLELVKEKDAKEQTKA